MATENIPKFFFYRTNEIVERNKVKGNRGILEVNGIYYYTIERDTSRYVHIPFGTYKLKMEISPTKNRRQFRINEHNVHNRDGVYAALLIHTGSFPDELLGCIGPGKIMLPNGVGQSAIAMDELFMACGGFNIKDVAAILEVVPKLTYTTNRLKGTFSPTF